MERLRILPILLAVASIAAVSAPMTGQTMREVPAGPPADFKDVPNKVRPVPFDMASKSVAGPIEYRTVEQMSKKDTDLEADAESSINEHVGRIGLEFNGGRWGYEQIVCPALPNHMFLRFTRNNGTGDVSMFTASVPRNGEGRVRIVPIQLRGYSLFSPAPINALTISAFNHIRGEEHFESTPEWLGTALCYAALAGGHPRTALPIENVDLNAQKSFVALPGAMVIPDHGGAIVAFADVGASPRPMEWTMDFDGKGKLLKAFHKPAEVIREKVVPPLPPLVMKGSAAPVAEPEKPVAPPSM